MNSVKFDVYQVTRIVVSFVSKNELSPQDVGELIAKVAQPLSTQEQTDTRPKGRKPVVPISKSVSDDSITCLIDGKKLKILKRHLWAAYKMTPEEYRREFGLPADYPMVAPSYSARRAQLVAQYRFGRGKKNKID